MMNGSISFSISFMKFFSILAACLVSALTASAAAPPRNIYVNNSPVTSPPDRAPTINATRFVNRSDFFITNSFFSTLIGGTFFGFRVLPYETLNTQFFTNGPNARIAGNPGFRWDYFHGNRRDRMRNWVNQGSISGATWLMVFSDNINSSGSMSVGPAGLMRLSGGNVSVARNGLRSGVAPGAFFSDGFIIGSNYVNAAGVTDVYWGAGTNNFLNDQGQPMSLLAGNFTLPFPQSPLHQVVDTRFGGRFTNFVTVPSFFFFGTNFLNFFRASYDAHVYTNTLSPTSSVVQVVFIPTNNVDTNFSVDVRFFQNFINQPATAVVEYKSVDFDIVEQRNITNAVYLIDTAAVATNIILLRPFLATILGTTTGNTRRPSNYEIARNMPFEFAFGIPGNGTFSSSLLYNTSYLSNTVPVAYGGYAAQISSTGLGNALGVGFGTFEPRTFPGRIEITGNRVNLNQTRARAESTIVIKAGDLVNNKLPTVDAPFAIYDLTSLLSTPLVISNLAPPTVRRLSGQLAAWSGVWDNIEVTAAGVTNYIQFHVLIVDNGLQALQPVLVNEFLAKATNLVIQDNLSIGSRMRLDARDLTVLGGLSLPFASSWNRTSVVGLLRFTNNGVINIPRDGLFGGDRSNPYLTYVNTGTNRAASHSIRTATFDNSGCITASGGVLTIQARNASLQGVVMEVTNIVTTNFVFDQFGFIIVGPSGAPLTVVVTNAVTNVFGSKLQAVSDVRILANDLIVSNSFISSGSTLELTVTNSLFDSGTNALSRWFTSGGFECGRLPASSDLLGTHLTSEARLYSQEIFHTWCGIDYGPNGEGFFNNMALGKLTLNGTNFTLFHFSAPAQTKQSGGSGALYVDYIELQDNALDYENVFDIDPSLTIYFAAANVAAEKLNGAAGGRFQWVSSFAGPLSSTNIFYASTGQTYTFNIALVTSKDLDSDGDGIVNADDPEPIPVPAPHAVARSQEMPELVADAKLPATLSSRELRLSIAPVKAAAGAVVLSWDAPANSMNYLECKPSFSATDWTVVTNFVSGSVTTRVTLEEPLSKQGLRIYRVRIGPQSPK